VVNASQHHRRGCLVRDAASGRGLDGGNDIRFPGFLGERYTPEQGLLCVGQVHREPTNPEHLDGDPERFIAAHRAWRESGRLADADTAFLAEVRRYYAATAASWNPWHTHFKRMVVGELGLDMSHIAYTNLAKCRQNPAGKNPRKLSDYCQQDFPVDRLVEVLQPVAVIVCVISADPTREGRWASPSWEPLVFACEGRNGCDVRGRGPTVWAPEAAARVRQRWSQLETATT
jgi:hypothetical protein